MFRLFRARTEAIESLRDSLVEAIALQTLGLGEALQSVHASLVELRPTSEKPPAVERLEELERRQAIWEVEMEALVASAKGTYQAANNAESRARTMKRHYDNLTDPFAEAGEEVADVVPSGDATRGEPEGLPPVRVAVAADHKALALRYKFS